MKCISTILHLAFLLLVVMVGTYSDAKCDSRLTAYPTTLTFANVTVSPSPAQAYELFNNTDADISLSVYNSGTVVQFSLDNSSFQAHQPPGNYPNGIPLPKRDSITIYVRIVTSSPIANLNISIMNANMHNGAVTAPVTITGSAPLPIQLTSLKVATLAGSGVTLTWTTSSETNNFGFYVQRNGVDLTFIAGHGTTLQSHSYSYTDNPSAGQYQYRLKQVDLDGSITLSEAILMDLAAPAKFALTQNFPNPFNPSTRISFSTTKDAPVSLRVYDILGREVATLVNENRKLGEYTERFDGSRFASGVYLYVLQSAEGRLTGRMILSK